ncbi:hypothetical protein E2493_19525 [Sphingomonas parva]|uniref:Lipoprotein n=1 Tax=Sphingomonas parva TaxID=2555898 RepID=A0A4Y8ZKK3_9SPHN|nr:hypothetical protein [Sphingomonas parva]TFI56533.1 hypothetical protein E2493_19525 [Sphingomonas parva]
MKSLLPIIGTALALGGCAAGSSDTAPTRDQEAFSREIAGLTASEPQSCIPVEQNEALTIVDTRTVVRRSGRTIWVNRLKADCPGLRPLATLIVEVHGGQYCRGDRVRGLDPGSTIPGPQCPLGDWTGYRREG